MSDLHNTITDKENYRLIKPKGVLTTSDLALKEKNDNYLRKNCILWVVFYCCVFVLISIAGLFVWNIFFNQKIQALLLNKMVENIVVIVTFIFALFGIQSNVNKN